MRFPALVNLNAAVLVAGVVLAPFAASGAAQTPAPTPNTSEAAPPTISGAWKFDPSQSDDVEEKLQKARASAQGSEGEGRAPGSGEGRPHGGGGGGGGAGHGYGGGGHHGGGGGGGGRPGGPGGQGGAPRSGGGEGMKALLEAPSEISITQTPAEIAIMEKDGRLRALHPDGQSRTSEAGGADVKTHWEGKALVVQTTRGRGSVFEAYDMAPDKSLLTVTVHVEGGFLSGFSLKRVYLPVLPPN